MSGKVWWQEEMIECTLYNCLVILSTCTWIAIHSFPDHKAFERPSRFPMANINKFFKLQDSDSFIEKYLRSKQVERGVCIQCQDVLYLEQGFIQWSKALEERSVNLYVDWQLREGVYRKSHLFGDPQHAYCEVAERRLLKDSVTVFAVGKLASLGVFISV
ncbi:hypothetical protein K435DRAFT_797187 [Dendrothele bispora CBS 962.96]|uniref:Uncharacterized protein n=1 Tax=Dendrothele bispora (strain CBS 962.96) TaxID=1314807 RepID=A0A4S8M3C5_DENBC|nr:hypothetical protein K435DRAFT_797187 [Dendrothele bispora CBS 962.96]